jgi:glycosyl transferase family 25
VRSSEPYQRVPSKILDYFDHAYVVNLLERRDRRRQMEAELARAGLLDPTKLEFFPAVRVHELQGFPSLGARGCFLSHLAILRRAQHAGFRRILIMEDDLAISPAWETHQAAIAERLARDDWAFAYLGYAAPQGIPEDAASPICAFSGELTQTHFYGVRGEYIGKLIAYLEPMLSREPGDPEGGPMHVDGAYQTFRKKHPEALTLIAHPNLGTQRSSSSDVSPTWVDRVPVLKSAARLYRLSRRLRAH